MGVSAFNILYKIHLYGLPADLVLDYWSLVDLNDYTHYINNQKLGKKKGSQKKTFGGGDLGKLLGKGG